MHLKIRRASKAYAGVPALIDAALDLYGGEVLGLVGENGAGKSTLIKLLAGLEAPDSLEARLNGARVTIPDSAAARRLGLRFIHQELAIVPALTVAENLFLNNPLPRLGGVFVNRAALYTLADEALRRLGIEHIDLRQRAALLSPGDAMLVKIASAFIGADEQQPLIYIMDEPSAALNQAEAELLYAVIERLRARGCALLVVTHRLHELFRIAQRVTVMRDGRVVTTQKITETSAEALIQAMTGANASQLPATEQVKTVPPAERPLLRVRGLRTDALVSASFELRAGEIVGVAGLAGAGRSQLLGALMGIDKRRAGGIELASEALQNPAPADCWARGIAYLPEERRSQGLLLGGRVSHNMTLPHLSRFRRWLAMMDRRAEDRRSQQLSHSVQLRATGIQQRLRELSGGNQQKVMFARAILAKPRLVLLDEPTRGVDVGAKRDIYRLIRELAADGAGILLVSSELDELLALCGRILIMRERRLVDEVPTADLDERALLSLMFAGAA
ncbi:MAG: sugar ABC transporter ATP-binding protein [Chloroflexi bacterium]|nr:sugar ABC transporter ATP-binding protein [Chloroflexota bacterium]MCY3717814.1 sugar ABC transporter ATP-binding protein [Chloroflexota bacterium]MDE2649238.1 sugar ABC transporter ATP-binding protein [Chloroflexota bacterium]MXV91952.1 sugar ABC transporter ATP-binding protein [Chloroflexota bacterium]MXX50320.1 sugar ABC transporter ATP-binding protein [Chloroflexota bacterium]